MFNQDLESQDDDIIQATNEKMEIFVGELFMSTSIRIIDFANSLLFKDRFKEWQLNVVINNSNVFGKLLFDQKCMPQGLEIFFDFFKENKECDFSQLLLQAVQELVIWTESDVLHKLHS